MDFKMQFVAYIKERDGEIEETGMQNIIWLANLHSSSWRRRGEEDCLWEVLLPPSYPKRRG